MVGVKGGQVVDQHQRVAGKPGFRKDVPDALARHFQALAFRFKYAVFLEAEKNEREQAGREKCRQDKRRVQFMVEPHRN